MQCKNVMTKWNDKAMQKVRLTTCNAKSKANNMQCKMKWQNAI